MWQTFKLVNKMNRAVEYNSFIYFIKKLHIFKNKDYRNYDSKNKFAALIFMIDFAKHMLAFLINCSLLISIVYFFADKLNCKDIFINPNIYIHMFLCFSFLIGGILNSKIVKKDKNNFIYIKIMNIDAKQYVLSQFIIKCIVSFIVQLIIIAPISLLIQIDFWKFGVLFIAKFLFSFFGETLNVFLYEKKKFLIYKKLRIYFSLFLIFLLMGCLPALLNQVPDYNIIAVISIFLLSIILGLFGLNYLFKYNHYDGLVSATSDLYEFEIDKKFKNLDRESVKLGDKPIDLDLNKFGHKHGFEYLNDIFFSRHKKLIYKPIKIMLALCFILLAAGVLARFTVDDFTNQYELNVLKFFPAYIFIVYNTSKFFDLTKAMFYNCDSSLLNYGFYRDKDSVFENFKIRFKNMIGINLISVLALDFVIILIGLISNSNLFVLLPIAMFFIAIQLFFTINDLFLYYILQPYTTERGIKSPIFSLINGVISFLCYFVFGLGYKFTLSPILLLSVVLPTTIIYTVIAFILVYKLGHKTFRIK